MNVINYGSQKKQSGDSISYTENKEVPLCNYCLKEDISNRFAESKFLIRKIAQRNTAKLAITVEKARTTEQIANLSETILTTVLATRNRARREETTMNTELENLGTPNSLVAFVVVQKIIANVIALKAVRLLIGSTTSTCSSSSLHHLRRR
jgi:hypothetical protein